MSSGTVVFAGGGTGGHLFPGLATAEQIRASNPSVSAVFVCSRRPLDARILTAAGVKFAINPAEPFGVRPRALLRFIGAWGKAVRDARAVILEARGNGPVVVAAMGGFVAAPAVQAARVERVPIVLVNLDGVPGRANRWISRHATRNLTAAVIPDGVRGCGWEYIRPIVRRAAMPPGDAATCRRMLGLDPARPTMLITGASQGARSLNDLLVLLASAHREDLTDWQVIHQTGEGDDARVAAAYAEAGLPALVRPFFDPMGPLWGAADLAVSRCGAGSVAEAWASGTPTVFFPYPYHKDQHQRVNAQPLADAGAAKIATDRIDGAENLRDGGQQVLALVRSNDARAGLRAAMARLGPPDGAAKAASVILKQISGPAAAVGR